MVPTAAPSIAPRVSVSSGLSNVSPRTRSTPDTSPTKPEPSMTTSNAAKSSQKTSKSGFAQRTVSALCIDRLDCLAPKALPSAGQTYQLAERLALA